MRMNFQNQSCRNREPQFKSLAWSKAPTLPIKATQGQFFNSINACLITSHTFYIPDSICNTGSLLQICRLHAQTEITLVTSLGYQWCYFLRFRKHYTIVFTFCVVLLTRIKFHFTCKIHGLPLLCNVCFLQ